jgi:hypothetical protein
MIRFASSMVLALLLPAVLHAAGPDTASLGKRRDEAARRLADATKRARALSEAVRKAMADPEARISRDMAELEAKADNGELEQALGILGISLEKLAEVEDEAKRAAAGDAMLRLREELRAAHTAQLGAEAIRELIERLEPLQGLLDDGSDLVIPLKDLHASLAGAELADALPRADIVALRGRLAGTRAAFDARIAREMAARAEADLAELEKAMPDLRKEFEGDAQTRDSAHAKFADAQRAIRYSLARVPDAGSKEVRERLARLEGEQAATYSRQYGAALHATIRENHEFTADRFAEWEKEADVEGPSAQAYIDLDGSNIDQLYLPRTAAYVDRTNVWFAYLYTLEGYAPCAAHPEVKALVETIGKRRAAALDRIHKVASRLAGEIEKVALEEDRVRDRLLVLADWDLRLLYQDDSRVWPLVAGLHRAVDARDRKALGEAKAAARIREGAEKAAAEGWPRSLGWYPMAGGFDPIHAALFRGRTVRLEKLHDLKASFRPGDHDLVLDLDGVYFAAKYDPAVRAGVEAQLARAGATLAPRDELELVLSVGEEAKLALLPAGDARPVEVPCRRMTVLGVRSGPVAFLARREGP